MGIGELQEGGRGIAYVLDRNERYIIGKDAEVRTSKCRSRIGPSVPFHVWGEGVYFSCTRLLSVIQASP